VTPSVQGEKYSLPGYLALANRKPFGLTYNR
jgi:hypothetical protein